MLRSPSALVLPVCLFTLLPIGACGGGGGSRSPSGLNGDIPNDPGTEAPPTANGPLIPAITLGEIDPANPTRIPLIVGGVAYTRQGDGFAAQLSDGPGIVVVTYDDSNLTVVVDDVVQGKRITKGSGGIKTDIALVIDNTGSMGGEIAGVRQSILSFVDALRSGGQDIRVGAVAFNDGLPASFNSGVAVADSRAHPAVYGFVDLTADLATGGDLYRFVASLRAHDPGANFDLPELALAGADYARRAFDWRSDAQRVYVLVTDAAAWGVGFAVPNNKGIDADYFSDQSLGTLLQSEGSVVHVYSPAFNPLPPPQYDMRTLATLTGGVWTELARGGVFDLTTLGIIETTLASSRVEFVRDGSEMREHTVRVVVRVDDGGQVYEGERTIRATF